MAYEQAVKNYFLTVSGFWLTVVDRWQKARDKALQDPPAYKSDDLAADTAALWARGMDALWSWLPAVGTPVLPTVVLTTKANAVPNQKLDLGHVTVVASLPKTPQFASTDLLSLGATNKIASGRVTITAKGDGIDLTLDYTGVNAAPATGLYQGLAYESSLDLPLAVILVSLS
jgi:hypothetical protein